jgi:hypothetical protein
MLVFADGRVVGTIGGGCVEGDGLARLAGHRGAEGHDRPLVTAELTGRTASLRGTMVLSMIEGRPVLCLFSRLGPAAARMAREGGFRVEVADDRPRFAIASRRGPDPRRGLRDGGGLDGARSQQLRGGRTCGQRGTRKPCARCRGRPAVRRPRQQTKMVQVFAALRRGCPEELERIHARTGHRRRDPRGP